MPTDIDFSDRTEVERWLANKPREMVVVFAARAALRVAPLLVGALGPRGGGAARVGRDIVLPVFRAAAAPWAAGRYLTHRAAYAARAAAYAAEDATRAAHSVDAAAASAAGAAAYAARAYAADAADWAAYAGDAAIHPAKLVVRDAYSDAYLACYADAQIVGRGVTASALAARPLWLAEIPAWAMNDWLRLEQALLGENQDWRVWTDWYRARLEGRPANETLEVARVLIAEEIWKQGPHAVNAEIVRLIAEHAPAPETLAPPAPIPDVPSHWDSRGRPPGRLRSLQVRRIGLCFRCLPAKKITATGWTHAVPLRGTWFRR